MAYIINRVFINIIIIIINKHRVFEVRYWFLGPAGPRQERLRVYGTGVHSWCEWLDRIGQWSGKLELIAVLLSDAIFSRECAWSRSDLVCWSHFRWLDRVPSKPSLTRFSFGRLEYPVARTRYVGFGKNSKNIWWTYGDLKLLFEEVRDHLIQWSVRSGNAICKSQADKNDLLTDFFDWERMDALRHGHDKLDCGLRSRDVEKNEFQRRECAVSHQ